MLEDRYQRTKQPLGDELSWLEKRKRSLRQMFITQEGLKGDDVFQVDKDGNPITRTEAYAPAIDRIRLSHNLRRKYLERAQGTLKNVLATVHDPENFDLFARKVFADEAVEAHERNAVHLENKVRLDEAKSLLKEVSRTKDAGLIEQAQAAVDDAEHAFRTGPRYETRELGETPELAAQEKARVDSEVARRPGVQSAYERHLEVINSFRDELKSRGLLGENTRDFYFPHYIRDHLVNNRPTNLPRGAGLSKVRSRNLKVRVGGREFSRDYHAVMGDYMAKTSEMLARHDLLNEIAYRYHVTRSPTFAIQQTAANGGLSDFDAYKKYGDIPRGYVTYNTRTGFTRMRIGSVAEETMGELLDNVVPEIAEKFGVSPYLLDGTLNPTITERLNSSKVRSGAVDDLLPQQGAELVIPKELADALTILAKGDEAKNPAAKALASFVQWWKTFAIHSSPVQYNVRNALGDMQRAAAQFGVDNLVHPRLWKESISDVYNALRHKQYTNDWLAANEYGLTSSGRTAVESADFRVLPDFKGHFDEGMDIKGTLNTVRKLLGPLPAVMREDAVKLYLYKMNVRRLEQGKSILYGSVDKAYVDGLIREGEEARAIAAIARKALIDYGDFTPGEQVLRDGVVPFYAWVKGNGKFWLKDLPTAGTRAVKNLTGGQGTQSDAAVLRGVATVAALAATARAWNYHNDEFEKVAERLPSSISAQTHIILSKPGTDSPWLDENGRPKVILIPDAMDDILDMTGMSGMVPDLRAMYKGRMTAQEFVQRRKEALIKQPINAVVGMAGPTLNLLGAIGGVRTYPNILETKIVPPEKYVSNLLGALALTRTPGAMDVADAMPGQVAPPSKAFDFAAQAGLVSPQLQRMPSYLNDLYYRVNKDKKELDALYGRIASTAGGLTDPGLTPEQRAARVEQMKRIYQINAAELRRTVDRLQSLRRTAEMKP